MPFLALTHRGITQAKASIWCGSDLVTEQEHANLLAHGVDITRLSYALQNADVKLIRRAVDTIAEHHPGEPVWIESIALDSLETQE